MLLSTASTYGDIELANLADSKKTTVITDMQIYFRNRCLIDSRCISLDLKIRQHLFQQLTYNIKQKVIEALDTKSPIIVIEYSGCGETINSIITEQNISFKLFKSDTALFTIDKKGKIILNSQDPNIVHVMNALKKQSPSSSIELVGINTSGCILSSARAMQKFGVHNLSIPGGFTLNTAPDRLIENNQIAHIKNMYKHDIGILKLGNTEQDSLIDYLDSPVN